MATKTIELLDLEAHHDEDETRPPIAVPFGEIVIGREPFLQCIDPGVSRSHAKLKTSDDGTLILISIHKKPSYYQRKEDTDKTTLKTNEEVELHDGDIFFLSPSSHGFKVKISDSTIPDDNNIPPAETGSSVAKEESDLHKIASQTSKRAFPDWMDNDEIVAGPVDSKKQLSPEKILDKTGTPKKKPRSPRKQAQVNAPAKHDLSDSDTETEPIPKKRVTGKLKDVASSSAVHELSDMEDESKEPRQENGSGGQDNGGVSISDVAQILGAILSQEEAGREAAEDGDNEEEPDEDQDNAATSQTQPRPACIYAERCYRKNLQHLADFSHPGDPDFVSAATGTSVTAGGPGSPKPRCAYGTSCYRRNPQHKNDFDHTHAPISPPSSPSKRRARRAKAKKKSPTKKQGPWNDSSGSEESYDESFIDDSSDVYCPSGGTTEEDDFED